VSKIKQKKLTKVKAIYIIIVLIAMLSVSYGTLYYVFSQSLFKVETERLENNGKFISHVLDLLREDAKIETREILEKVREDSAFAPQSGKVYLVDDTGKALDNASNIDLKFSDDFLFLLFSGEPVPTVSVENGTLIVRTFVPFDDFFSSFLVYEKPVKVDGLTFGFITPSQNAVGVNTDEVIVPPENLLKDALSSWNPVSSIKKVNGEKMIFSLLPFLDVQHWNAEGIIVLYTDTSELLSTYRSSIDLFAFTGIAVLLLIVILTAFSFKFGLNFEIVHLFLSVIVISSIAFLGISFLKTIDAHSEFLGKDFFSSLEESISEKEIESATKKLSDKFDLIVFDVNSELLTVSQVAKVNLSKDINEVSKIATEKTRKAIIGGLTLYIKEIKAAGLKIGYLPTVVNLAQQTFKVQLFVILISIGFMIFATWFFLKNLPNKILLKRTLKGYLFLSPALLMFITWLLIPIAFSLYLSFHRWSMVDPLKPFIGFGHFKKIFEDKDLLKSLLNTAIYTLNVPVSLAISLGVALLMNREIKGINFFRLLYFLPSISSFVAISIVWQWIYNPEFGLMNYLLGIFGLPPQKWLGSPNTAMISLMIMSIWLNMGYQMVVFLAGLQGIPQYLYEVAELDGANRFRKFWHITLPMLKPTTFFLLVTSFIGSFQVFTQVYVMTQGGPAGATDVFVYHIYNTAWKGFEMGYASAQSWFLFLIIFAATMLQFVFSGKSVYEE